MPADATSIYSCPSNGGTTVAFTSKATTLDDDDANGVADAFVRRYPAGG